DLDAVELEDEAVGVGGEVVLRRAELVEEEIDLGGAGAGGDGAGRGGGPETALVAASCLSDGADAGGAAQRLAGAVVEGDGGVGVIGGVGVAAEPAGEGEGDAAGVD